MSCEWDIYPFASFGDDDRVLLDAAIESHADNIETAGYTPFRDSIAENFNNQWWLQSSPHCYKYIIEESDIAIYSAANLDEEVSGYGPAFTFNNLSNPGKFVIGPATHCDWTTVMNETGFDILTEELRFFDHWLKGIDNGVMEEAPVTYYTYNLDDSDIGLPGWKTAETCPLPQQSPSSWHLIFT